MEDDTKQDEAEVEDDAEQDEAQEADWRESHTKTRHESGVASERFASTARKEFGAASDISFSTKGLAWTITKLFARRTSSCTSKGMAANKFTPSSYK